MSERDFSRYRAFRYTAGGDAHTPASREAVWRVISAIGGENRYYTWNVLWTIRELMDAAVGGPGLRHGRPPAGHELVPGDRIDSWEVLAAERPTRLALIFGMKAPGRGVLEFLVSPTETATRVRVTAYWEPDNWAGVLYWRAMQPAHLFLFDKLTDEICRRAHALEHGAAPAPVGAPDTRGEAAGRAGS